MMFCCGFQLNSARVMAHRRFSERFWNCNRQSAAYHLGRRRTLRGFFAAVSGISELLTLSHACISTESFKGAVTSRNADAHQARVAAGANLGHQRLATGPARVLESLALCTKFPKRCTMPQALDTSLESEGGAKKLPTFFLSHGGGPSYLIEASESSPLKLMDKNSGTCKALRTLVEKELDGVVPRAVVIISAHHEARGGHEVTPQNSKQPGLYYDYGGFPDEFFNLSYSPRGSASVASEVLDALKSANIPVVGGRKRFGRERGYDHGVFIPLMQVFPDPPPVVQVSMDSSMDAAAHMRLGAALAPLRRRGVLVIGSGQFVHNLPAMLGPRAGGPSPAWFAPFAQWLDGTVFGGKDDAAAREARAQELRGWGERPWARHAHPREDHLLPLHVAATAGSGNAESAPRGKAVFLERDPSRAFISGIVRYD